MFCNSALRIGDDTEYIFYCKRAILFLSFSKILTPPPPLRPASLSSPPTKAGGTHSPGGEGDGVLFGPYRSHFLSRKSLISS